MWATSAPVNDRLWILQGTVTVPDQLLYCFDIGPCPGPWIAVYADLITKDQIPGRQVFGKLMALLVAATDADRLINALNLRDRPADFWLPELPRDHYTFAGEIPWSSVFARNGIDSDSMQSYREAIRVDNGTPIEIEILAHRYSWETYYSEVNKVDSAIVPSRHFSATFDLRSIPQSFHQKQPDGAVAALSFIAPARLDGHLLYLRENLLEQYAAGRRLIWFVWGKRQLYPYPKQGPRWLIQARQNGADVWRDVRRGEELSSAFVSTALPQNRRRTRRSQQKGGKRPAKKQAANRAKKKK
jgi:hypothetical protein